MSKDIIKALSPFDIINYIFTDQNKFYSLSNIILEKNFFIINRVFSIKYPMQAAIFNKLSINKAAVIKSWANFIIQKEGYGKTPYFVYTKGSKKTTETKVKKSNNLDLDIIKEYCKRYHLNLKDFNNLLNLYNDELIEDVNRYSKIISLKEQEKKISK